MESVLATTRSSEASAVAKSCLRPELSVRDLTLFGIVCLIGVRWMLAAAHAGFGSVVLWLLAGLLFGGSLAVTVAVLMSKYPDPGRRTRNGRLRRITGSSQQSNGGSTARPLTEEAPHGFKS